MKKSVADTAATRKRLIATGYRLFMEQGLAATGVAEVMQAAGMSPGAFYRHFASKEQLIAESNVAAFEHMATRLAQAVAGRPPREALDAIVHIYLHQRATDTPLFLCPLANVGSELPQGDEQIRAAARAGHARLVDVLELYARQLGIAAHRQLADAIAATMVGAVTLYRLAGDPAQAQAALANAENTVRFLLDAAVRAPRAAGRPHRPNLNKA